MRTTATLIQAFLSALADRASDKNGVPSKDYMIGYLIGMLQGMAEDSPYAAEAIQEHLNDLNLKLRTIQ